MRFAILSPLILFCAFSRAADVIDIKPGLWTITNSTGLNGLPALPNLDKMTPEQRARLDAAMKKMTHSYTVKHCVTREDFDKAIADSSSSKNTRCAPTVVTVTPYKVGLHMDCTQENSGIKSKGDVIIERRDSEHFLGNGIMTATSANGHTVDLKWTVAGTFVSPNCGN